MADHCPPGTGPPAIRVRGAREHNLKSVDVDIPRGALTVVSGVSGSGKSSLVFDTICAEGRRRYLETFSSYARQFLGRAGRPAVASIDGLPPTIEVGQSTVVRNPRSTVGTMTELYDLLRLLWARFGTRVSDGLGPKVERQLFSFNSPHGACPACKGLGVEDRLDPELLVAHPARSIREGALRISTPTGYLIYSQVTIDVLDQVCRAHGFSVDVPWRELTAEQRGIVLNGSDRIRIPYGKHPLESRMKWTGITAKPREEGIYKGILPVMEQILRQKRNDNILRFVRSMRCRACGGARLRPEALAVTFRGLTIAEAAAMSIGGLRAFAAGNGDTSRSRDGNGDTSRPRNGDTSRFQERNAADKGVEHLFGYVRERCDVLDRLGLGYLTLDRESTTLSGGEAQRLRLARHAGLDLGGLLYVLDEPSIGLHPRDTARLLDVLQTIRERGNTIVVVEHDEDTIAHADWVVDIGQGAGTEGGSLLFSGPLRAFMAPVPPGATAGLPSRTRAFLIRQERIGVPATRRPGTGTLTLSRLSAHNLRNLDATFLLGAFNVVSGVSGAGKSTLLSETRRLVAGMIPSARGSAVPPGPGRPDDEAHAVSTATIGKVINIDQAPIGRTPRSNPATYTGLFDGIRDLFAAEPESARLGFGKGRFSFNVAGGRCDACEGAGVQQVGMQFMGVATFTCETCGGSRFNDATLVVRHRGLSIHDVLDLTIEEACRVFADEPGLSRMLDTLRRLGLGYLPLGHPATMLSGGEAQRVKLAAELARPSSAHTLYVLDEPTTGLHPADVERLLTALNALVDRGHTVITIEHHLDVIAAADYVVDLGPGSGSDGGRVVASGPPEQVARDSESATAAALRRHLSGCVPEPAPARAAASEPEAIRFTNVTTHNLQGIDVEFPRNRLTVVTGVSGSGKSSLAFDTLFAEGQQRFAESLTTYARRLVHRASDAEFERVDGLTPTIAISQQAPSRNPRSTVGTLTEIHDAFRLLYSRAGVRRCPACEVALERHVCPSCGFNGVQTLTSAMFSPNSEAGACPACHGLGRRLECDPAKLITDPDLPLAGGAMGGHKPGRFYGDPNGQHMATLQAAAGAFGHDVSAPWRHLTPAARDLAMRGTADRVFDVQWAFERGARRGVHRFTGPWPGLLELVRLEFDRKHADRRGDTLAPLMIAVPCDPCGGAGLKPEARAVQLAGLSIQDLLAMTVQESLGLFDAVREGQVDIGGRQVVMTADLRADIVRRLSRLRDAGLGYLSVDRPAATLSSGEAQRVRLASQLQSGLTGITYVLDEPTVGLHPRDTGRLLGLLGDLRNEGNTVVVVEHDLEVIAAAEHVIELGPGAGPRGGLVVAQGSPAAIAADSRSKTGPYLVSRLRLERLPPRALRRGVEVRGARAHNLDGIDLDVPAGGLVTITGVSGSGKSSLAFDVIAPSVEAIIEANGRAAAAVGCDSVRLAEPFRRVVAVAPRAAGTSPWGSPASVIGLLDPVRDLFAATGEARARGLKKAHFSTANKGGRCEACEGRGQTRVSMDFLPDVWSTCEDCGGRRFGADVLACTVAGRSLADVLDLNADEARAFIEECGAPSRARRILTAGLDALRDVGLGYLQIGQPVRTLSGGERQRLVLAEALAGGGDGPALYLMDEPTTGLHIDDVRHLRAVLDRLVSAGHTVVVVEHHLDVIAGADWVIDLGPEGGTGGGRVVVEGPPASIVACGESWTGRALAVTTSRGA